VKRANARVVERSYSAGFVSKALTKLFGGNFDGNRSIEARIASLVHLAHAALANE
jgi:hypothetical protein